MFLFVAALEQNKAIVGVAESPATELALMSLDWVKKYPVRELLAMRGVQPPFDVAVDRAVVELAVQHANVHYARGTIGTYTETILSPETHTRLLNLVKADPQTDSDDRWSEVVEVTHGTSSDDEFMYDSEDSLP